MLHCYLEIIHVQASAASRLQGRQANREAQLLSIELTPASQQELEPHTGRAR